MSADRSLSPATLTASLREIFRGACKMLLDLAARGIAFFFPGQKPGVHLKLQLIYTVGKNKHWDVKEGQ